METFIYEGTNVRTIEIDNEPWFVLGDVCKVLEIGTVSRTKNRLDRQDVSSTHLLDSRGHSRANTIINESGLYDVILDSRKPQAKAFRRWSGLPPSSGGGCPARTFSLTENEEGTTAVMGRDLHGFLEIKSNYRHWFPRMVEYGFTAGQDYTVKNDREQDSLGRGRDVMNHIMTLDMAKEVAMIQRTPKGKQARGQTL